MYQTPSNPDKAGTALLRVLLVCAATIRAAAQSGPDPPLKEGDITRIECHWDREEALPGFNPDSKPQKGLWHYDVFVPEGYGTQTQRRYPCLFISSPGGEAKHFLPLYRDWLAQHEWLAVMLVESRNGPIEPCLGNFLAAHDDALRRLRIIDTMKAAAGMSGAARMSSLYVQVRPGFRGLFLQAAGFSQSTAGRYWLQRIPADGSPAVFLTMGNKDPNATELSLLRDALPPAMPYLPRKFAGGHAPPPPEIAAEGMDWLERRMWAGAAGDKSAKDEAPAFVKRLATRASKAPSTVERYALLQQIADLVKTFALASHPDIAPLMNGYSEKFAEVKKDPDVIMEIKAATKLAELSKRQRETAVRAAKLDSAESRKAAWQEFSDACGEAASMFPDTKAGRECRRLAEGLAP